MLEEYQNRLAQAKKNSKSIKKTVAQLRKMRKGKVDQMVHQLHDDAFNKIDCLLCANCCKTTGPLFTSTDIENLAGFLKISAVTFIDKYLRIDEENDYVLKSVPCPFLDEQNYCKVYETRPKACREFPHTDRVNQLGILSLTEKNSKICPAVADIFENLNRR